MVSIRKADQYECDPWTITSVHTNETIRVQADQKSLRFIIRRVTPFLTSDLTVTNVIFSGLSPSPTQHLGL